MNLGEFMTVKSRRNFTLWISGFGLGLIGDHIFYFVLAWSAAQIASSPLEASLVVTVGALLRAVFILTGGAVTDKIGARKVALYSDFFRFVIAAAFALFIALAGINIWGLYLLSLAFGFIDAFFLPAVGAMPPRIVAVEALPRAQSARSVVQRVAAAIGPPLGGLILGLQGLSRPLLVCAVLFFLSFLFLLFVKELGRTAEKDDEPEDNGGVVAGIRYAFNHPVLCPALILITVGELIVAGLTVSGLAIYGTEQDWSSTQASFALSSFAVGAICTALVMLVKEPKGRIGALVTGSIIAMGFGFAGVGLFSQITLIYAGLVVAGAASGICATLLITLFLVAADEAYVGRAMSLLTLASFGVAPIANFLFGVAADALNPATAFIIFGGLLSLVGLGALLMPQIRAFEITPKT